MAKRSFGDKCVAKLEIGNEEISKERQQAHESPSVGLVVYAFARYWESPMTKDKFFPNAVKYWQAKDYGLRLAGGTYLPSAEGISSIKMQEFMPAIFKGSNLEILSTPASLDNLRLSSTIPGSDKDRDAVIEAMERMGKLANICGMWTANVSDAKVHVRICTITDGDPLTDDEIVGRFAGLHNVVTDCRKFAFMVDFCKRTVVEHRGVISFSKSDRAKVFKASAAAKCKHAPILTRVATQVWVVDLEAEEITTFIPGLSIFGPKMDVEKEWFFRKS